MKGFRDNNKVPFEQSPERVDEGEKEKKKGRRRANRKQRQNHGGSGCSSGSCLVEGYGQISNCCDASNYAQDTMKSSSLPYQNCVGGNGMVSNDNTGSEFGQREFSPKIISYQRSNRASDISFTSLPTMHIHSGDASNLNLGYSQDQDIFSCNLVGEVFADISKSCPDPITNEHVTVLSPNRELMLYQNNEGYHDMTQRKFSAHWSIQSVNEALEKGDAFKACFRVNAHNRLEAYCTLDGVPTDVLISGFAAQNRAIEGDTVAVMLDPVPCWTRMKGLPTHIYNSPQNDDCSPLKESVGVSSKGKEKVNDGYEFPDYGNGSFPFDKCCELDEKTSRCETGNGFEFGNFGYLMDTVKTTRTNEEPKNAASALENLCTILKLFPMKRPTGRVIAIIERSTRRDAIIGYLGSQHWISFKDLTMKEQSIGNQFKRNQTLTSSPGEYVQLTPTDARFPKLMVPLSGLPDSLKERLQNGDEFVEKELVVAQIVNWQEQSLLPLARVKQCLGQGGEIEAEIAAILFERAIQSAEFSPESLACLPKIPWKIPAKEIKRRKDLRDLCIFTIDPSTATDLDDALSFEYLSEDVVRFGVHISDVSYFVHPDTALDMEAQVRSTSVYLIQHRIPMLPPLLSEDLGSLVPGVDKLAFSIIWDINFAGEIIDHWIGGTVIRSCCQLSYQHAHEIINGSSDLQRFIASEDGWPELHGKFEWKDVIEAVRGLHGISKKLREKRFERGALLLDSSKLGFLFDDDGIPYDSTFSERKDSSFLVEEFMLLANMTTASVISRAFPECALLRRHPEPNSRKLKEFEAFCGKHGFELDTSSSGHIHLSLQKLKEVLKDDPDLFEILISNASKPMQLAQYFCTGDLRDRESEWAHYSLAVPLYTHFTSPLRRYPDIIVHRTLTAVLEAERIYLRQQRPVPKAIKGGPADEHEMVRRVFSGLNFDEDAAKSKEGRDALSAAALKHKAPTCAELVGVAAHCNERKLASKHAQEAGTKLYLWVLLKKKQTFITEGRVLGLGPKFMNVYITKLAMQSRIYYDDVEGLVVHWLEATGTLVLDLYPLKRSQRKGHLGKSRNLDDFALTIKTSDLSEPTSEQEVRDENITHEATPGSCLVVNPYNKQVRQNQAVDPAVFPLTLQYLSTVPVSVNAVGGERSRMDIAVRLYASSYLI
ncbi:DIS3-like exonuclease 2 [Amborella trichopoda]|uniref:DIS3-like exonuclease 2 n=1 Tax=Amborella trichopoda TaxID=13333 RepID=W1PMZ0_AMBTC|nr:DIS3-like exonuclease 2 [Amborella trichopoda]ERN11392.1 hypothetical protein AMTR_s00176p00064210 [Amborella trichopoda]|eukprot:XP_006849811.1 DIS3-like exonuclease 2 [Amborella trichopoda]